MTAPDFINSKGQRKRTQTLLDVDELLGRYEDIYVGLIKFEGNLPEGMPEGYIMRALFNAGAVQIKDTSIGRVAIPVKASTWTVYGTPKSAVPTSIIYQEDISTGVFAPSEEPVLYVGEAMREKLRPYAATMLSAIRSLRQNLVALRQPIVLQGVQGGELNALTLGDDIEEGEEMVYTLKGVAVPAQAVDLGGKDYTQNLIGVINAMDSQCLTLMGVKGSGADKASGISAVETEYVAQQTSMLVYHLLDLAQQWCDRVNATFPDMNLSVRLGEGWTPTQKDDPEEATDGLQEETADE